MQSHINSSDRLLNVRHAQPRRAFGPRADIVKDGFDRGLSWAQIAEGVSAADRKAISISTLYSWARRNGFSGKRHSCVGIDHQVVLDEIAKRRTYASIAAEVGVSGERVRQIANKHGAYSDQSREGGDYADLLRAALSQSVTASLCDIPVGKKARHLRQGLEDLERVKAGESFHAVAGNDRARAGRLRRYAAKLGVKSSHSRLRHREPIIRAALAEGLPWDEIADWLADFESRRVTGTAVYAWAAKRGLTEPKRAGLVTPSVHAKRRSLMG